MRGAIDVRELDGTNANEVAAVDTATMQERESFMAKSLVYYQRAKSLVYYDTNADTKVKAK